MMVMLGVVPNEAIGARKLAKKVVSVAEPFKAVTVHRGSLPGNQPSNLPSNQLPWSQTNGISTWNCTSALQPSSIVVRCGGPTGDWFRPV